MIEKQLVGGAVSLPQAQLRRGRLDGRGIGGSAEAAHEGVQVSRRRVEGLETIAQETTVAIDRLAATLAQAGLTLADVVKVNCYLTDDSQRAEFWRTFDAAFAPGPYPVRVTQVGGLIGDLRVLLDAVAAR